MEGEDFAGRVAFHEVAEELEGVAAAEEAGGPAPLVADEEGEGQQRHGDADQVQVEAERVLVPAYRRMDTLPACRISRGHFYFSTLLKRCSPLGAAEGPTPPAVAHRHPTNPTMPALFLPDRRAPM